MNYLIRAYKYVADHIGKILSATGAMLMGLDISGEADQIKMFAGQFLGDKAAQWVGVTLFLLLLARTTYTGARLKQVQQ